MNIEKLKQKRPRKSDDTIYVCKCQCGGSVRGTFAFDQLFSYCERCTPVVKIPNPFKRERP